MSLILIKTPITDIVSYTLAFLFLPPPLTFHKLLRHLVTTGSNIEVATQTCIPDFSCCKSIPITLISSSLHFTLPLAKLTSF